MRCIGAVNCRMGTGWDSQWHRAVKGRRSEADTLGEWPGWHSPRTERSQVGLCWCAAFGKASDTPRLVAGMGSQERSRQGSRLGRALLRGDSGRLGTEGVTKWETGREGAGRRKRWMKRNDLCGEGKWEEGRSRPVCPAGYWKQMKKSGIKENSVPFFGVNWKILFVYFFCGFLLLFSSRYVRIIFDSWNESCPMSALSPSPTPLPRNF